MRIRLLSALLAGLASLPAAPRVEAQEFATSSVLSAGVWRKVSVSESGVYRVSAAALRQMGFSDPSQVRVYGAGGAQLSHTVGADGRDDLKVLPALHTSDGVIFYAQGPNGLVAQADGYYAPSLNAYSRKAYYYLTSAANVSDAIICREANDGAPALTLSEYDNVRLYAPQQVNVGQTGREWVSEPVKPSRPSLSVPLSMTVSQGADVRVRYRLVAHLASQGGCSIDIDGNKFAEPSFSAATAQTTVFSVSQGAMSFPAPSSSLSSLRVSASLPGSSDCVWISYVTVASRAPLSLPSGGSLAFRSSEQAGGDGLVAFSIGGVDDATVVWDVTDAATPRQESLERVSGGRASFKAEGGKVREYVAFGPSSVLPSPADEGSVACHDLHAHKSVNYLVVTSPLFAGVADEFCAVHAQAQGLSSRVVMVDDIYDEFSAGRPEAPAIRNYIKMLYDRGKGSQDGLTCVFLLGSGSYDNFDRSRAENVIPAYESENSSGTLTSYATDDFYGWMDKGEGATDTRGAVDVGIGRLPASTLAEAEAYLAKVKAYMSAPEQGAWRSKAVFVGISGDANEHTQYADMQASAFEDENPDMEAIRVFSEAYPAQKTSTGVSFPLAVSTLHNLLESGVSLFHYTGHSSPRAIAENYLTVELASRLTNFSRPFVFVSASCDIVPFDHNTGCLGTRGLYNPDGGFIGVFAATRDVYGNGNYNVTRQFVKYLYSIGADGARRVTMGEATQKAKVHANRSVNSVKYCFLGDPALVICSPLEPHLELDSINGVPAGEQQDPIRALEPSSICGSVRDAAGDVDTTFTGTATLSLYDKRQNRATSGVKSGAPYAYSEYSARLFSGKVAVERGRFSASFILSKELDLSVGFGRLHMYASAECGRDAMGATDAVLIGGVSDVLLSDTIGPVINAWVDFERDAQGHAIGSTPVLYAEISDAQGVNVSGMGVGHDLSLVIDADRVGAISLNDYFVYANGSSTSGLLSYPLNGVSLSTHSLTIKAWDNLNNSSSVTFKVNLDPSSHRVTLEQETLSLDDELRLSFMSDAFGEHVRVKTCVYTPTGVLVGETDQVMPQRNGSQRVSVSLRPQLTRRGVYVVRCQVSGNGRKAEISRRISM